MELFGRIKWGLFYKFFNRVQLLELRDLLIVVGYQERV
jgi:hypothetical protein